MTSEIVRLVLVAMIGQAAGFVFLMVMQHKVVLWRVEQLEKAIDHSLNNGIRSDIAQLDTKLDQYSMKLATLDATCRERHRGEAL